MSQAEIDSQIQQNQAWAAAHHLTNFDPTQLVTGEHSGLKTLPQQPDDSPFLAGAFADSGIAYTASDASRESASRLVGSTTTVPRHPMNIFYNAGTYADEVSEYNWIYTSAANGGSGICTANPATSTCITPLPDATPAEAQASFDGYIKPIEIRNALKFVLTNDPRPFYAHQSNLAEDKILYPVVQGVLDQYKAVYDTAKTPLVHLDLKGQGQALTQMEHWTTAQSGVTAYVDLSGVHVSGAGCRPGDRAHRQHRDRRLAQPLRRRTVRLDHRARDRHRRRRPADPGRWLRPGRPGRAAPIAHRHRRQRVGHGDLDRADRYRRRPDHRLHGAGSSADD